MMVNFSQTAIVIIEVTENGNIPELKYVTIGNMSKKSTEAELAMQALDYVKTDGTKVVKQVFVGDNNQYKKFLENSIKDSLSQE